MKAIDLFAGAGGFSEGARLSGVDVVWAANHNPKAVAVHAANHPRALHECQDLRQADFTALPAYDLLVASPACQGHSTASQSRRRPKHDADRSTAWAVVECAERTQPRALIVENVTAFRRWALYPVWRSALELLGYSLSELELDAADFGVPQNRRRLFVAGFLKKSAPKLALKSAGQVSARSILDPKANGWAPVASKSAAVQARVENGRRRGWTRFLTQHVTNHPGRDLARPIGTITCASQHWHLVDGPRMRPLSVRELARAQGFLDSFQLPEQVSLGTRLVGNAVPPPMAAAVISAVAEAA